MDYQIISNSGLSKIREELLLQQNFKCAICGCDVKETLNQHVDHQHCFKSEELGVNGAGLIRGVLCRNCNALEGKIWNNTHRYGVTDSNDPVKSRIEWLQNLIGYYNNNYQHQNKILHPKEQRIEKLQKSVYNKILKWFKEQEFAYKRNGNLKPFPKYNGKWSNKLKEYYKMMSLELQ